MTSCKHHPSLSKKYSIRPLFKKIFPPSPFYPLYRHILFDHELTLNEKQINELHNSSPRYSGLGRITQRLAY